MKQLYPIFFLAFLFLNCNNKEKSTSVTEEIHSGDITTSIYPEAITKVFDAHGGIDRWNKMRTLMFTIEKPNGNEVNQVDLSSRAELISTPNYIQGFDGDSIWIKEKSDDGFDGNAKFYRGLMMYFYAMPFVLGDSGIIYTEAEPLAFEGKSYPGILVSYEEGVGTSPDDEYIIYYDGESGQMLWLAYTVTFGKDKRSDDFHFIRYNNWQNINGLILPKSIDWYNYENGKPTTKRNTIEFTDVKLSENPLDASIFEKPKNAYYVK